MPAKYLGSWEPRTRRWTKMHRGTRLAVSCRQLARWSGRAIAETKEQSYQVANEWIRAKIAELDATPSPYEDELAEIRRRRDWCRARGRYDEAEFYANVLNLSIQTGGAMLSHHEQASAFLTLRKAGLSVDHPDDVPDDLVTAVSGRSVWRDRLEQGGDSPDAPPVVTIQDALTRYLDLKHAKVKRGELAPRTPGNIEGALRYFVESVGGQTPAANLSESSWSTFFASISGRDPGYASRLIRTARSFVAWMHAERLCEEPRNLRSRDYAVSVPTRAVQTIDPATLALLLDKAPEQLKPHLLLFANCGMTQADSSALRHDEVDWKAGRIKRKRTKTSDEENVPIVDYALWPITLAALKAHRSADPERVLLTSTGLPWVDGGVDRFVASYKRFVDQMKKAGVEAPMSKLIRKTSSSLLETHEVYGRYTGYFLGHAPETMADRHYVKPSREQFDRAVEWLRTQYFPAG